MQDPIYGALLGSLHIPLGSSRRACHWPRSPQPRGFQTLPLGPFLYSSSLLLKLGSSVKAPFKGCISFMKLPRSFQG